MTPAALEKIPMPPPPLRRGRKDGGVRAFFAVLAKRDRAATGAGSAAYYYAAYLGSPRSSDRIRGYLWGALLAAGIEWRCDATREAAKAAHEAAKQAA